MPYAELFTKRLQISENKPQKINYDCLLAGPFRRTKGAHAISVRTAFVLRILNYRTSTNNY